MIRHQEVLVMITTIIAFITSIVSIINSIYDNYNLYLVLSFICFGMVGALTIFYWIYRYPDWKRYKLIRYLFFEIRENKFNIAPKILMFSDLNRKKNNFIVKELSVDYTLTDNEGAIDSFVTWNLKEISNVKSEYFYFYTGIDFGKIETQQFVIGCNNNGETRSLFLDNRIDSENGVYLCYWNIPNDAVKRGNKIDSIKLTMEQKESFCFKNKEIIYLFPRNFAYKIEKIDLKITYPQSLNKIEMQLYEIGNVKGEEFPFNHLLDSVSNERYIKNTDGSYSYTFHLEKENINIDNLYYIILYEPK